MADNEIRHHCPLPEGSVPLAVCEVVEYLDADGERLYAYRHAGSGGSLSGIVGLLELAKVRLIRGANFGDGD